MTERITKGGLQIAAILHDFIENEAMAGTGVDPESFWRGLGKIIEDLGPQNSALLARRQYERQLANSAASAEAQGLLKQLRANATIEVFETRLQ